MAYFAVAHKAKQRPANPERQRMSELRIRAATNNSITLSGDAGKGSIVARAADTMSES
jgi:hypothetical protein